MTDKEQMSKNISIVTWLGYGNYGTSLQSYSLHRKLKDLGYNVNILSEYSYTGKSSISERISNLLRQIKFNTRLYYLQSTKLQKLHKFQKEKYNRKFILTGTQFEDMLTHTDVFITGSDQIWNTCAFDFDWAYFLPFAGHARRVAYAPSMGPSPLQSINSVEKAEKIAKLMHYYDFISVRELQTREKIMQFTDIECAVTLDPTLLIGAEIWNKMAGDTPLIKGNYIFLYTPWFNEAIYTEAERMSKAMNMPIVVSLLHNGWRNNRRITRKPYLCHLATGPIEFLNLCKFATFNIGKSFHLVVFSILLRTPFYAMNGMKDSRVRDLLVQTGLEALGRSLPENAVLPVIDFDEAHRRIAKASRLSLEWLHNSLQ